MLSDKDLDLDRYIKENRAVARLMADILDEPYIEEAVTAEERIVAARKTSRRPLTLMFPKRDQRI